MDDGFEEDNQALLTQPELQPSPSPSDNRRSGAGLTSAPPATAAHASSPATYPSYEPESDADDASSSSESSSPPSPTLTERRALNIRRNKELLQRLGMQHGIVPKGANGRMGLSKKKQSSENDDRSLVFDSEPRGMLLPTLNQTDLQAPSPLDNLYERYPCRDAQIRRLLGLLLPTASYMPNVVPAPIFCHGPAGSGKTSIILDILKLLNNYRTAYFNCETFEQMAHAEQIVQHILRQLRSNTKEDDQRRDGLRRRPTPRAQLKQNTHVSQRTRTRPARSAAASASTKNTGPMVYNTYSLLADINSLAESTDFPVCAVWNAGREMKRWKGGRSSVVVLDHAELLLSKVTNNKNLLSQLMLLPRVFGLNLTIIAISNSLLLQDSRIDHIVGAHTSSATISGDLHPIIIYFSAYRQQELKHVLRQPLVRQTIVLEDDENDSSSSAFATRLYDSFLDTVLHSVTNHTNNLKEIMQVARSIWPRYVQPITHHYRDQTLLSARKAVLAKATSSANSEDTQLLVQREILLLLGRKVLPWLRDSENLVFTSESGQDLHDLPLLAKYLLLAAFLCQVNHPDKDKQLFSIRKNGKRHRQDVHRDEQEDTAFGTNVEKSSFTRLRPRTFPVERLLSLFVSIVGMTSMNSNESLLPRGDLGFNDLMSTLRRIGVLCEYPKASPSETIKLTEPRYFTLVTQEQAMSLAKELKFSLDRYII